MASCSGESSRSAAPRRPRWDVSPPNESFAAESSRPSGPQDRGRRGSAIGRKGGRVGAAELVAPGIVGGALERGGFSNAAAKILCWMDGREHADIGGQGWPHWGPNQIVAS